MKPALLLFALLLLSAVSSPRAEQQSEGKFMDALVANLTPDQLERKADMLRCLAARLTDAQPERADWFAPTSVDDCIGISFQRCLEGFKDGFYNVASMNCALDEAVRWWAMVNDLYREMVERASCREVDLERDGQRSPGILKSLSAAHESWREHGRADCVYIWDHYLQGTLHLDGPELCSRDRTAARAAIYVSWRNAMPECR